MDDIKSAAEIAAEKVESLGKATDEERLEWKYVPEGEKLAASYFKHKFELASDLNKYEEKAKRHVVKGAVDILIRYIDLPKSDLAKKNNRLAMDGIKTLKSDKVSVENMYSMMRQIFNHYAEDGERQRKQAYESLKTEFEAKIQQAIQQQTGTLAGMKIDVETQPQFQEEWRQVLGQLDSQYYRLLDEYKQEILAIS
ncbi:hypothetical protein ACFLV3_00185 [Chloroflexota bacterium]